MSTKLFNSFQFKESIPKDIISGAVYKFPMSLAMEIWGVHKCVTSYWKEGQTNQ